MKLNQKTDYALRILLYAATEAPRLVTAKEVAESYNITQANANQIVNVMKHKGYLVVQRGRYGGGFGLAKEPNEIHIGDLVRDMEPDMDLVQCFNLEKNTCPGIGTCKITGLMMEGLEAFITQMNTKTLADML